MIYSVYRFIYGILYALVLFFLLPYQYLKRQKEVRGRWLRERLGIEEFNIKDPYIWIHAVSVGEVNAAAPLIKDIIEKHKGYKIVLTTVTDTGQRVARQRFKDAIFIRYAPFDLPFMFKGLITANLRMLLILETELWPNMISSVKGNLTPVLLVNGRISKGSYNGYRHIRFFLKWLLADIDHLCMQAEEYAHRVINLGAFPGRVMVTGNIKFDLSMPLDVPGWTKRLKGRCIVAGSTHHPEEALIIDAFNNILEAFPECILIIAPRHPERFKEVEGLLRAKGLQYVRRSDMDYEEIDIVCSFVLLDAVGELSSVYSVCEIAIMGGSFIPHGGQNPLEPAIWGKAILCGPHMENFYFIEDFYKTGAAIRTETVDLKENLYRLLSDRNLCKEAGMRARYIVDSNRGACEKTLRLIEGLLR